MLINIISMRGRGGELGLICLIAGLLYYWGARCSSVVRAFAHVAVGRRIDPSWGGPIELFLVPASAPLHVKEVRKKKVCYLVVCIYV